MDVVYKRNTFGTILSIILGCHNIFDVYKMMCFLYPVLKDTSRWNELDCLMLSLCVTVLILQLLVLYSIFYALIQPSALYDPVKSKRNRFWLFAYIFIRVVIITCFLIIFPIIWAGTDVVKRSPESDDDNPIGSIFIGIIPDAILLIVWNVGPHEGEQMLLPFMPMEQNKLPV